MIQNRADDFVKQLENHFDRRVESFGGGLQAVDWKSTAAQWIRFEQLVKVVDAPAGERFSILDYGCGDGELINFLNAQKADFAYYGFDVSTKMLEKAREIHGEHAHCSFSNDLAAFPRVDYSVASGVFNLKFAASQADWHQFMLEKVVEIADLATKGFAFNALTGYSDQEFRRADLFYADPLFWFDHCKRNFSRRVSLLHDYPEYDFTIIVRK